MMKDIPLQTLLLKSLVRGCTPVTAIFLPHLLNFSCKKFSHFFLTSLSVNSAATLFFSVQLSRAKNCETFFSERFEVEDEDVTHDGVGADQVGSEIDPVTCEERGRKRNRLDWKLKL